MELNSPHETSMADGLCTLLLPMATWACCRFVPRHVPAWLESFCCLPAAYILANVLLLPGWQSHTHLPADYQQG